jgi:hypothetical protein
MSTLSDIARRQYYFELGRGLPPTIRDDRDDYERRMCTAIEAFNDLQPVTAFEGRLAVQIVLCGAMPTTTCKRPPISPTISRRSGVATRRPAA